VVPVVDNSFDWKLKLPEGRVDIVTLDGRTLTRLGDDLPGSSETPMSWDYIFTKFHDAASLAAVPPSTNKITKAQEMVRHLETVEDATEVMRILA